MDSDNNNQIRSLLKQFEQMCFKIIEKGLEDRLFRMKDVALYLGISPQVASKLVSPSSPRVLTAFELFRMSVALRKPVTELIPPEMYMTAEELEDKSLCEALSIPAVEKKEARLFAAAYMQLTPSIRQCIMLLIKQVLAMK